MNKEALFQPVSLNGESFNAVPDELRSRGVAVARAAISEAVCIKLEVETRNLLYIPDETYRSTGGDRRPLHLGIPRTFTEQVLLSRHSRSAIRETGANIYDALSDTEFVRAPFNKAVINRVRSVKRTGRVEVGAILSHHDPEYFEGVVAAVSLQDGVINLFDSEATGARVVRGRKIDSIPVYRGDVSLFACADSAKATGIVLPLHEVMNAAGVDERKSVTYAYSTLPALALSGITKRIRQQFQ